jgi:hypothetical protein
LPDGAGGGGVIIAQKGSAVYGQLSDSTSPTTAQLSVATYGRATPHYAMAAALRYGALRQVGGVDQTQPLTLHMWAEAAPWATAAGAVPAAAAAAAAAALAAGTPRVGRLVILAGNLEGTSCVGSPCTVPTELGPRQATVAVDTRRFSIASGGGDSSSARASFEQQRAAVEGEPESRSQPPTPCSAGATDAVTWLVYSLDGGVAPQVLTVSAAGLLAVAVEVPFLSSRVYVLEPV